MTTLLQELDEVLIAIEQAKATKDALFRFDLEAINRQRAHKFITDHAPKIRAAFVELEYTREELKQLREVQARVKTYSFEVVQDGFPVAGGYAPVLADAEREAAYYAMMYGQDGPVQVNIYAVLNAASPARAGHQTGDTEGEEE